MNLRELQKRLTNPMGNDNQHEVPFAQQKTHRSLRRFSATYSQHFFQQFRNVHSYCDLNITLLEKVLNCKDRF